MSYVSILSDRHEYVTRHGDPNDRWDRDSTAATVSVKGIKQVDEKGYHDLAVPFDISHDKAYFLLWADYDTGDSFGRDGNRTEWVDLFQSIESAEKARKELLDGSGYTRGYTRDDGTVIDFYVPWEGYFESLNDLRVDVVRTA